MTESLFTWGDSVLVSGDAEERYRPGQIGSVCGVTEVGSNELAKVLKVPQGSYAYTVEYDDGTDELIPEEYLRSID